MKVLTIFQPWAWCIAKGHKRIENRPIRIDYTGDMLVHVGKSQWEPDEVSQQLAQLHADGLISEIPKLAELEAQLGKIIAKTEITGCRPIEAGDADPWAVPGGYGWELGDVELVEPVECRGQQGLFNLPPGIEVRVLGQAQAVVAKTEPTSAFDPKAERERLVVMVTPADDGHGYVGEVHDNVTGEVVFQSVAKESEELAREAATAYVDDRVEAVARAKMARLEALEHGLMRLATLQREITQLETDKRLIGKDIKDKRAEQAALLRDLKSGQAHLDFNRDEDDVDEDDEPDDETPTHRFADTADLADALGGLLPLLPTPKDPPAEDDEHKPAAWADEAARTPDDRAREIAEMKAGEVIEAIERETSIEVVREVQRLELRRKGALKRKSAIAACERRIEALLEEQPIEDVPA